MLGKLKRSRAVPEILPIIFQALPGTTFNSLCHYSFFELSLIMKVFTSRLHGYKRCNDKFNSIFADTTKLALLIDKVNCLIRKTDTALWCVKVRCQGLTKLTVLSRKLFTQSSPQSPTNASVVSAVAKVAQTATPATPYQMTTFLAPRKISNLEQLQRPSKLISPRKIAGANNGNDNGGLQRKPRGGQCLTATMGLQPQANMHRSLSTACGLPSSKMKKSPSLQLFAQQQRAEIFQRYSSALKNNTYNSGIM